MVDRDPPSTGYSIYVLVLLTLIGVMNWMDRTIIAILLDPMKRDLGVSDTAMGLLNGFGFALLYGVTAIPIARFADRRSRRVVLVAGVTLWSIMTALCGLAGNYTQLLLARMGVGAAESGGTPASQSLIADYFPPERRSVAYGVFATSIFFGTSLSALLGGWLGFYYGWRTALIAVSVPGLLLGLLAFFTLREPVRGRYDKVKASHQPLGLAFATLSGNPTFRWIVLAMATLSIVNGATLVWTPAMIGRVHDLDLKQLGYTVAIAKGAAGVSGTVLGGVIALRFARGGVFGQLSLSALATALAIPALVLFTQSDELALCLLGVAVYQVLVGMPIGISIAAVQGIMPSDVRALAAATVTLFTTIIGIGGGPLLVGALNDAMTARFGAEAVRYSLVSLVPLLAIGMTGYWIAARSYRRQADAIALSAVA